MTQNAPPAPVQALSYATVTESPWPGVVRLVALFGLAMGCTRLAGFTYQTVWRLLIGQWEPSFSAYDNIFSLLSFAAGILSIIGSIGLLRRRKSAGLIITGCWILIGVSALGMILNCFDKLPFVLFRSSSGKEAIVWGLRLLQLIADDLERAMFPLMILMLLRMAKRDPRYRATLTQ